MVELTVIEGNGAEHREEVGREMVSSILTRNSAEFDRLHRTLHSPVSLSAVDGGREQMGREAMSALMTGDDEKLDTLLEQMRPRSPKLSVVGEPGTNPSVSPTPDQSAADKI